MAVEQTTNHTTGAPSAERAAASSPKRALVVAAIAIAGIGIAHWTLADTSLRLQFLRAVLTFVAVGEGLGSVAQVFFARTFAPRNGRPYDPAYHGVVQDFGFYNFAMALLFGLAALDPRRSTTVIGVGIALYAVHGLTHLLRSLGLYYGGETAVPTRSRQLELRDALTLIAGLTGMVLFFP